MRRYLLSRSKRRSLSCIFLDSSDSATRRPRLPKIYTYETGRENRTNRERSEMEAKTGEEAGEPKEEAEELKRELAEQKQRNDELLTRLKYAQADLENLRKRMDRELKDAEESAARSLLTRLLVVQDELDLAAKHSEEGGHAGDSLKEGIAMVRRNLLTALEAVGLERIESVGKPFDPAVHEAVEKVQGGSQSKDMVVEEVRPGFTFRGTLLRPSMVKVELASRAPGEEKKDE